jgi:hypothetical protein
VKPAGFIFHETRCGSTLVANQLAVLPGNRVFSESGIAVQVRDAPLYVLLQSQLGYATLKRYDCAVQLLCSVCDMITLYRGAK